MLTHRQRDALVFLREHDGDAALTLNEIADALDLRSGSGAFYLLAGLEQRGFISMSQRKHRTRQVEVLRSPDRTPIYDAKTNEIRGWVS